MRSCWFSAALVVAGGMWAQEGPLLREGAWWVQITTGTVSVPRSGALKVHMRGPVTAHGDTFSRSAQYTLKKRVKAASEAEARRLFAELVLRSGVQTGAGFLKLEYPARPAAGAELRLRVPSRLPVLTIETHSGDIHVYDMAGEVTAHSGAGVIQMDRIARGVIAKTAGGDIRLGNIGGGARCVSGGGSIQVESTGGESWLETAGGEIHVGQSSGPIHASTAGGNIRITRAGASVTARTAGGRIDVAEAGGIVTAGNSGGSVHVGSAQGVRVESTGGSIRLRGSSGALRAVSDVGSILAELAAGVRIQDSVFSTGAGDITVYIPSNIALTVRALNETARSGRIVSEFPEIAVRRAREESRPATLAEGALNGGGPVLMLTSTDGTIYLRRVRQ